MFINDVYTFTADVNNKIPLDHDNLFLLSEDSGGVQNLLGNFPNISKIIGSTAIYKQTVIFGSNSKPNRFKWHLLSNLVPATKK